MLWICGAFILVFVINDLWAIQIFICIEWLFANHAIILKVLQLDLRMTSSRMSLDSFYYSRDVYLMGRCLDSRMFMFGNNKLSYKEIYCLNLLWSSKILILWKLTLNLSYTYILYIMISELPINSKFVLSFV